MQTPLRRQSVLHQIFAIFLIAFAINAEAITIDFTDANRGPADVLQIGGVTVSEYTGGGGLGTPLSLPSTVAGVGLGSSVIGSGGTLDRIQDRQARWMREGVTVSVNGVIDSIIVAPFFHVLGSDDPIWITFVGSLEPTPFSAGGSLRFVPMFGPASLTISGFGANTIRLGLIQAEENLAMVSYLLSHPEATGFQFGYAIQSLTYTPAASVPEVGHSAILLAIALCGLFGVRQTLCRSSA